MKANDFRVPTIITMRHSQIYHLFLYFLWCGGACTLPRSFYEVETESDLFWQLFISRANNSPEMGKTGTDSSKEALQYKSLLSSILPHPQMGRRSRNTNKIEIYWNTFGRCRYLQFSDQKHLTAKYIVKIAIVNGVLLVKCKKDHYTEILGNFETRE